MGYGRSYDIGVFGSNFGHTVTQNLPVLLKQNHDASSFSAASGNFNPLFSLMQGRPTLISIPQLHFPQFLLMALFL
jgi:hypothetical protein